MLNKEKERMARLGNRARRIIPIHNPQGISKDLQAVGIEVRTLTDMQYQSTLEWDQINDRPIITLNRDQSIVEKNFAMLHELAHLLVEYHWSPLTNADVQDEYVLNVEYNEWGCDAFQDSLGQSRLDEFIISYLIPNTELQKAIRGGELDYQELVGNLAQKFLVPFEMVQIRLDIFLATE